MASARYFFSEQEQEALLKAIAQAELHTSGEIRLHIENYCFGSALNAAQRVFRQLNMHKTKERNGVLFYIAVKSRKLAVVGDEGIKQKLGNSFWDEQVVKLIADFKGGRQVQSLTQSIEACGQMLGRYFPRNEDDKNELSNELSF